MRCCCSEKGAKWATISVGVLLLAIGITFAVAWDKWFHNIIQYELSVSNSNTKGYKMWKETPIPMYLDFHMFNWTNAHIFAKDPGIKPAFVEMGPYVFYEHHIRDNVVFNDNDTVTYLNRRIWHFEPTMSNGSLDDVITFLNPIATVVGNLVKDEHYLVKRAVNFFLKEKGETLYLKKKIREVIFEGYDDSLIDIAYKLNISKFKIPFKKFGWFVERNNSAPYDGVFNMYSGKYVSSKLGLITRWNYHHKTPYYSGLCANVNGSSGELWFAPNYVEEIAIFSSDMCSNVNLHKANSMTMYGIKGTVYEGLNDVFDNGTTYPETACYSSGMPAGVRGVSACKWNAHAYMSYPHFYLADEYYLQRIDGMNPSREMHATRVALEPSTGLPLKVHAAFQLNLLMSNISGIDIFANVPTTMIPCFWFAQRAELTKDLSVLAKSMLLGGPAGTNTGYGLIGLGLLFIVIFGVFLQRSDWKRKDELLIVPDHEESDER